MKNDESKDRKTIYVIDQDYRLVYIDKQVKNRFPEAAIGEYCFKVLCGMDRPCNKCPLKVKDRDVSYCYNPLIRTRLTIQGAEIEWPEHGSCYLMIAKEFQGLSQEENGLKEELSIRDKLTGLLIRSEFCKRAEKVLNIQDDKNWILSVIDIDHFKLFNEWYGQTAGDQCLSDIAEFLRELEEKTQGLAGYFWEDDFAILLPSEEYLKAMQEYITGIISRYGESAGFSPAIGVYKITEERLSVPLMCDRASIAMKSVKGNYRKRISYFEPNMISQMEEEHRMLIDAQNAIKNGDFIFYLQPKCNLENGKIVGAEALVRWNHASKGVLTPGSFLSLFEKSGFITILDSYIWEEVCRWLRQWIDKGNQPIPISVNVSRMDIYTMDIPAVFRSLVRKYALSPQLLDIEITESVYTEKFSVITRVVEELRKDGFNVLMDDFGSGYSSLNMLKDIELDVLKMDMKFVQLDEENMSRGREILKTVNNMARIMDMRVIVEGVETKEQKQFLMNMGFNYGQGYYFYRPLPRNEFEGVFMDKENLECQETKKIQPKFNFMEEEVIENLGCTLEEFEIIKDIHDHMSNMPGAILRYEANNEGRIWGVNSSLLNLLGYTKEQFYRRFHNRFPEIIYYEDRERVMKKIAGQVEEQEDIFCEFRVSLADGTQRWVHERARVFRDDVGKPWIYAILSDIQAKKQETLWQQTKYQLLSEIPGTITYDYDPMQDCLHMKVVLKNGDIKDINTENFVKDIFNHGWISFDTAVAHKHAFQEAIKKQESGSVDFKGRFFGDEFRWYRSYYTSIADENGMVYRIVGRADDVHNDKKQLQEWQKKAQRDAMTKLLNHEAANYQIEQALVKYGGGILILIDIDDFKQVNDILGHFYGDQFLRDVSTAIRELFRKNDILGRFGGDEFIIFLPGVYSETLAKNRAKDIIDAIMGIYLPTLGSVGCSIGMAIAENGNISREELFKQADYALYQAKRNGKGFYILYGE